MKLVTRAQWAAMAPRSTTPRPRNEVVGIAWHHSAGAAGADEVATVQAIQRYHMLVQGRSDIDYAALIGPSGNIYVGRDTNVVQAHSIGTWNGIAANRSLLGVCFLGDFTLPGAKLTKAATDSAFALAYVWAMSGFKIRDHVTHNVLRATACPGDPVRAFVKNLLGGVIA